MAKAVNTSSPLYIKINSVMRFTVSDAQRGRSTETSIATVPCTSVIGR